MAKLEASDIARSIKGRVLGRWKRSSKTTKL